MPYSTVRVHRRISVWVPVSSVQSRISRYARSPEPGPWLYRYYTVLTTEVLTLR